MGGSIRVAYEILMGIFSTSVGGYVIHEPKYITHLEDAFRLADSEEAEVP